MYIVTTESEDGMMQAEIQAFDNRDQAQKHVEKFRDVLLDGNVLTIYKCSEVAVFDRLEN